MRYQAHFGNKTFENRHVCLVDCSFRLKAGCWYLHCFFETGSAISALLLCWTFGMMYFMLVSECQT